jgi:hypothetical protein
MKKQLKLIVVLAVLLTLEASLGAVHKIRATSLDELPCDPSPTMLRMCQIRGGTFNFVTCRCEFP